MNKRVHNFSFVQVLCIRKIFLLSFSSFLNKQNFIRGYVFDQLLFHDIYFCSISSRVEMSRKTIWFSHNLLVHIQVNRTATLYEELITTIFEIVHTANATISWRQATSLGRWRITINAIKRCSRHGCSIYWLINRDKISVHFRWISIWDRII